MTVDHCEMCAGPWEGPAHVCKSAALEIRWRLLWMTRTSIPAAGLADIEDQLQLVDLELAAAADREHPERAS